MNYGAPKPYIPSSSSTCFSIVSLQGSQPEHAFLWHQQNYSNQSLWIIKSFFIFLGWYAGRDRDVWGVWHDAWCTCENVIALAVIEWLIYLRLPAQHRLLIRNVLSTRCNVIGFLQRGERGEVLLVCCWDCRTKEGGRKGEKTYLKTWKKMCRVTDGWWNGDKGRQAGEWKGGSAARRCCILMGIEGRSLRVTPEVGLLIYPHCADNRQCV